MTQYRAALTVAIAAEGDYYTDHADLIRHVTMWIEAGLEDRDNIREVTITEQPTDQAATGKPAPVTQLEITHTSTIPFTGDSTIHKGTREECSGADCGPAEETLPEPYTYTDIDFGDTLTISGRPEIAERAVTMVITEDGATAEVTVAPEGVESVIAAIRAAAGKPAGPTVAEMHAAAVGEVRDPIIGLVDDVHMVREQLLAQEARAATLDRLYRELAAGQQPPAVPTGKERQFLTFAMDLADDFMASRPAEFDDADRAALESLRRLADGAQQTGRPQAEGTETSTVEYFLQTRYPGETWGEDSSRSEDRGHMAARLETRIRKFPQYEHRIARRTSTVTVQADTTETSR